MVLNKEISKVAGNELYNAAYLYSVNNGKLTGSRCKYCNASYVPPRPICPKCHRDGVEIIKIEGEGRIAAFTVISVGPPMMIEEGCSRENPYCAGIIELKEGVKVAARIVGVDVKRPEQIRIGTPVRIEYQEKIHNGEKKHFVAFRAIS